MNKKAWQLVSRFSYSPNQLGHCGLESANPVFNECILHGTCDGVAEELRHFKGLYPYLQTIAKVNGLDWRDYKVFEAYWIGNELLGACKPDDYFTLVDNLEAQGLPDFFIEKLRSDKPKVFYPLHLFNILHIGVGQITGSVPTNLESVNQCMIRWGEVLEVLKKNGELKVKLNGLKTEGTRYALTMKEDTVIYNADFLKGVKKGDVVAVHWKRAEYILNPSEVASLKKWTGKLVHEL